MKRLAMLFASALFAASSAGSAFAVEALCEIHPAGEKAMRMPCSFTAEQDGSFSVESLKADSPLYGDILVVSLAMMEKGRGQVSGLTKDGINSRWGEAVREKKDKACWKGEDFRICVRAK